MIDCFGLRWCRDGTAISLHLGQGKAALLRVVPEAVYPGMFRVRGLNGSLTNMANLTWAKDGALAIWRASTPAKGRGDKPLEKARPSRLTPTLQ
jgi:hypothetical protein